jgi:hypothetical protein
MSKITLRICRLGIISILRKGIILILTFLHKTLKLIICYDILTLKINSIIGFLMFNLIKNETTLLDAFRIQEDVPLWIQQREFQNLSLWQKITRLVSDYTIKFFAYVLGVKISGRNVEVVGKRYDEYANAKEQNSSHCHHQRVILVLHIKGSIPTEPTHFQELEKQSGCKIVFKEADSVEEASNSMTYLKKNGCKIETLWIRAHGSPTTITFQGDFYTDALNIKPDDGLIDFHLQKVTSFCEAIDQNLELEGPIILESCFTGKPMLAGEENIATFISRVAKRKVFAPKREALNIDGGVTYSEEKGFNVEIKSFQADRYFTPGSFLAKLSAVWLAFRGYKEDITQVIIPS